MTISNATKEAAADWLVELETAESVGEIWPDFQAWIQQNPEHEAAYLQLERAWHALDGLLSGSSVEGVAGSNLAFGIRRN